MASAILLFAVVLATIEAALWLLIRHYRPKFKWLIVPEDVAPEIADDLVAKHTAGNFDPELGWVPRPNSSGSDDTADGHRVFRIDAKGRRFNPGFADHDPVVAVFGDSFAFSRLVADDETWPHLLSKALSQPVHNYGVGNYGFDQALLRLEREELGRECKAIIMAVVPETIARVQSYWKHYLEYGNILAFKPRFKLVDDSLMHVAPAVRSVKDYSTYRDRLDLIQNEDGFYDRKFVGDLLRFPYFWHFLSRFRRHAPILGQLIRGSLIGDKELAQRRAFGIVLRENSRLTMQMYREAEAVALLDALLARFRRVCAERQARPILVVLPQPVDCAAAKSETATYRNYFERHKESLGVVDFTGTFLESGDWRSLYVEGGLGPHVSRAGNELVAQTLKPLLQSMITLPRAVAAAQSTQTECAKRANYL